LDDIQDKYDKIPTYKHQQLVDAYEPCVDVLSELDKQLAHYNKLDTKSKRAWDRLKWDPEKSRSLRERLASSVTMLNAFYTSLIHDNQVLILEALERLEKDYRGGHREESIASIERITSTPSHEESGDEDAAWTQIIRDLEDVGISHQVALTYHDFVLDWFIRAVNEGRLLEERADLEYVDVAAQHSSYVNPEFTPLSIPSCTASLNLDSDNSCTENHSRPTSSPGVHLAQRRDSSNAPEPLHVSELPTDEFKLLYLSSSSSNAPEPTQQSSSSDQAPELLSLPNLQHSKAGLVQLTTLTSEAPERVPFSRPSDLDWTVQQVSSAWTQRNFVEASRLLEEHLAAVERGSVTSTGLQPDRRVLRHCIGVCASFSGNLVKAKHFFESAFNGIYLSRDLDDGDIAAARWLGDICLQLREFYNALLAWSVALEGSIKRYGIAHDRTRQISQEILMMDNWLAVFRGVEDKFRANVDPTDVFSNTHALEKSDLITTIQTRIPELKIWMNGPRMSGVLRKDRSRSTGALRPRPRTDLTIPEGFLVGPLVSLGAWPLLWDSTFSPMAAFYLEWHLRIARPQTALVDRSLRTNSFGESKKLDHVTRGDSLWLIGTVKAILHELKMEHADHPDENAIVCCLKRDRDGFACSEGIFISFYKLQFRNVYGLRISSVRWSTRVPLVVFRKTGSLMDFDPPDDTTEFKNTFKSMLELAEAGASHKFSTHEETVKKTSTRSWSTWTAPKKTLSSG
jgi:hypothetical protein